MEELMIHCNYESVKTKDGLVTFIIHKNSLHRETTKEIHII